MPDSLPIIGDKTRRVAMEMATGANIKKAVDQVIGVIQAIAAGDMPEEDGLNEVDKIYSDYAKAIVGDLIP